MYIEPIDSCHSRARSGKEVYVMLLLCSRCNSIVVGETVEVEVGIEDAPAWPSNITVRVAWPFSNRELFNVSRINFAPTMTGCLSRFGAR